MSKVRLAVIRRISGHRDQKRGVSLISQAEQTLDFAERHDGVIVLDKQYEKSGWKLTEKDYQEIMELARQKKIDAVLAYRLDRFGRNPGQAITRCDELEFKYGVKIWSVTQGINIQQFQRNIWFSMAAEESRATSERTHDNMRTMVKLGLWPSRPPFGYDCDYSHIGPDGLPLKGYLKPNMEEAELVREIFRRFDGGEGAYSIAGTLPAKPRAEFAYEWRTSDVVRILSNKVYVGKVEYDRRTNSMFAPKGKKDPSLYLCVDGKHEPIIDRELFERVQTRLKLHDHRRTTSARKAQAGRRSVLDGLVHCATCGRKMNVNDTSYPSKKDRRATERGSYVFKCNVVGHPSIGGLRLERYVRQQLAAVYFDPDRVRTVLERLEQEQPAPQVNKRAKLLAERRKKEEAIDDAGVVLALNPKNVTRYTRVVEKLEAEIARIDQELAQCPDVDDRRALRRNVERHLLDYCHPVQLHEWAVRSGHAESLDLAAEALARMIVSITAEKGQEPKITWQSWVEQLRPYFEESKAKVDVLTASAS